MSVYAISDIHGNNALFQKTLKTIKLKKDDTLFILGDLIDRGSESKEVLDTVFLLLENGFDIRCLRGNHEQMLIDSFESPEQKIHWLKNGGNDTLRSFLSSDLRRIPNKYMDFINNLPYYLIFKKYIFVHAGINMKTESPLSDTHSLLWLRDWELKFDKEWLGDRTVVHGHTPKERAFLLSKFNLESKVICIDNGTYLKSPDYGGLSVLNLESISLTIEN